MCFRLVVEAYVSSVCVLNMYLLYSQTEVERDAQTEGERDQVKSTDGQK